MRDSKSHSSVQSEDGNAASRDLDHADAIVDRSTDPAPVGTIGFVGLGHMGTAMAANLAAAGIVVNAYVRRPAQIEELRALGVAPTTNMRDLFDCEIVVSMLPDDTAVREVVFGRTDGTGLADGLSAGTIHLSMSTISTSAAIEFASEHKRRGQGYVAAPVFGNPDAARARQLFVIVSGAAVYCERCRSITDRLGQTFVVGTEPAQANLIKLLGNMMSATSLEVLGEVITVLRKCGQDPQSFVDVMTRTMFGGRVHRIYAGKIVAGSHAPGFTMPLALKDVRLALAEAEKAGAPMPSVNVVRDRLITGIARGHGGLDWTALGLVASEEAGIESGGSAGR
jgi:3-hydroxyisobutyrate dehydrogenase-like beta-hydroxyacid dehydrogenase